MPINVKFEVQTCLKSVCLKTLLWYLVSVLFERKVRWKSSGTYLEGESMYMSKPSAD